MPSFRSQAVTPFPEFCSGSCVLQEAQNHSLLLLVYSFQASLLCHSRISGCQRGTRRGPVTFTMDMVRRMVQGSSHCHFKHLRCYNLSQNTHTFATETQDSLSDDALLPLKSYKYSAVDKSPISNYILKHYVRLLRYKIIMVLRTDHWILISGMHLSNFCPCGSRLIW